MSILALGRKQRRKIPNQRVRESKKERKFPIKRGEESKKRKKIPDQTSEEKEICKKVFGPDNIWKCLKPGHAIQGISSSIFVQSG